MRVEKILIRSIVILLTIGVILPIVLLLSIKDKALAGQIGDTLGGTTAPLVNVSAILAVIATYFYQRRNDQKNVKRELFASNFKNLRDELNNINHVVTTTTKGVKEVQSHVGKESIRYIIRALNNGEYKIDVRELDTFTPILNTYQYLNVLLDDLNQDIYLSDTDKKMLLTQFSLFYRNNLFLNKELRGDEICKYHKILHKIPDELYNEIVSIEKKIR